LINQRDPGAGRPQKKGKSGTFALAMSEYMQFFPEEKFNAF